MRDIKFRAYDPDLKGWIREVVLETFELQQLSDKNSPFIFSQYTGIEDLWESDIVEHPTKKFKGVIFFEKGSFWIREFFTNADEGVYDGDIKKETIWSIDLDWKKIGNIYDNPELLKGGDKNKT